MHRLRFPRLFQLLDFVLQVQFPAFQFPELQVVCRGMEEFRLDFLLDRLMAPLEFSEMALQGHSTNPFLDADDGGQFGTENGDDKKKMRQIVYDFRSTCPDCDGEYCHVFARRGNEPRASSLARPPRT